ncbi:hypothetical protein BH10PLA1_BH10PLA1_16550 [soil metagenome]
MPPKAEFSWMIFFLLSMIFLGSMGMFFLLVRRSTSQRRWTAMSEWARDRRFRHLRSTQSPPVPLEDLGLKPLLMIASRHTTFIEFAPAPGEAPIHVMHRVIDIPFAAGALRPLGEMTSLLDRFPLSAFPLITGNERFLALGVDSAAARQIADALRALLPPDLGLLVQGRSMVIDFSARLFDTIEFDRMIALSDQLISHLPVEHQKI